MARFLKALLLPVIIMIALNWRTAYTLVRLSLFPPHPPSTAEVAKAAEEQPDNTLYIPDLDLTAPVIPSGADPTVTEDWGVLRENLTKGVGLAEKLPLPGDPGTTVIIGHSSDWTPHKYASVFAGLNKLTVNQPIYLKYKGQKYVYTVTQKDIIEATNLDYFKSELGKRTSTNRLALITCWPIMTTAKRLVVIAELTPFSP